MADLTAILSDLEAEHDALDALVAPLDDAAWSTATPAEGWSVQDQIGHLAFFDDEATMALVDRDGFARHLQEIAADVGGFMDRSVARGRSNDGSAVLEWWREARARMVAAAREAGPKERVPWFGPPMSPASFVSARQMETWAHAQDVSDGLGIDREHTDRIKNVAHICVLSRTHSYSNRGMDVPTEPVAVELKAPSGDVWTWGEGEDRVEGSAVEFCLVATQRRHPDDTSLDMTGPLAREWVSIAQAYAGPPGSGRRPGQFPRSG